MKNNIFVCLGLILSLSNCGGGGGGNNTSGGDTTAPTVPGSLFVTVESATSVALNWNASIDAIGVSGYRIYRNNISLKTVTATSTSDSSLTTGVEYCYQVSAFDPADNESARSSSVCATPKDVWTRRTSGKDLTIKSIAYSGSLYVAVSDNDIFSGDIITSTDGLTWSVAGVSPGEPEAIVWAGTQFLLATQRGSFYSSPDGINWTARTTPTFSIDMYALAWSGSVATAVGEEGEIWTTSDGITWALQTSGTIEDLYGIEWLNNQFVAVGSNGTVLFSSDGSSWTAESTGTTDNLGAVSWNGSVIVATSGTYPYTSVDGVTWTRNVDSLGISSEVIWADTLNLFVNVGINGDISTSPDGVSWSTQLGMSLIPGLNDILWDGSMLIAVGEFGEITSSTDAVSWTTHNTSADLTNIRWGSNSNLFYAVGGLGKVLTSADGISWTYHRTGDTGDYLHDIANSGTRIVAASQTYHMSTTTSLESPWPVHDWFGATRSNYSVIWDGTQFINTDSAGGLYISSDGLTYSYVYETTTGAPGPLTDIIYNSAASGLYVMVGYTGTIITSADVNSTNLADWTTQTSGTTNNLYSVAYSGSNYVAVGFGGTILVSADAVNWTAATSNTSSSLKRVIWADNGFVAVGSGSTILTSPDGVTWSKEVTATLGNLTGVAYNGARYTAAGDNGLIVTLEKP